MSLPTPRSSERGSKRYRFAELFLTLGPQAIGDTLENRLLDLIGRVWALHLSPAGELRAYQRAADAATWTQITALLPPLFGETQPPNRRRYSLAFDQSARAIVAYEEDERVYVVRWDTATNQYVANVDFDGIDPVVAFDATWAYDVAVSDVLIFYLDAETRSRLMCRVQRDLYAIEYELHDYEEPVVLDRVTRLPLRYQALASDADGEPLEDAGQRIGLLSDLYPYPGSDVVGVGAALTASGEFRVVVINAEGEDTLAAGMTLTASGSLGEPVIELDTPTEHVVAGMTLTASGALKEPLIEYDGDDAVASTLALTASGLFALVVISTSEGDAVSASMTLTGGGTYGPP